MLKAEPGSHMPKDVIVRAYEPGRDDAEILRLQAEGNEEWKARGGTTFFTPAIPDVPEIAVVVERDGKLVWMGGGRLVLEVGCRIDRSAFSGRYAQAQMRDVILAGWAKMLAGAIRAGHKKMVCSVTSPTPKWVNFLKKRVGFRGFKAEMLHLYLSDAGGPQ